MPELRCPYYREYLRNAEGVPVPHCDHKHSPVPLAQALKHLDQRTLHCEGDLDRCPIAKNEWFDL